MIVESLLVRRIITKSHRYDQIRGYRMAYTLDVGAKRPDFVLLPGDVHLTEGQQIHVVRWKPGSSAIVAFLNGGYGTPIHLQPSSWFGLASMIALNNGMALYYCFIVDKLPVLLLLGLSWLVVNSWLMYWIRERRKVKQALEVLREFQQMRLRLGFQTERE
ncbi:hypothetical protein CDL60_07255 [Roseateles noduli]|nr:hypothetical protein CDL60_07255 [Roseateles noduli]